MIYPYTLCLIRKRDAILLINRRKAPWMGAWNGVGGKLEPGETPLQGVLRELHEETGLRLTTAEDKGIVTWTKDGKAAGGMYLYYAEVEQKDDPFRYPMATEEGILDWKPAEWVLHKDNAGVAANLPYYLPYVLNDRSRYEHRCAFRSGQLRRVDSIPLY